MLNEDLIALLEIWKGRVDSSFEDVPLRAYSTRDSGVDLFPMYITTTEPPLLEQDHFQIPILLDVGVSSMEGGH